MLICVAVDVGIRGFSTFLKKLWIPVWITAARCAKKRRMSTASPTPTDLAEALQLLQAERERNAALTDQLHQQATDAAQRFTEQQRVLDETAATHAELLEKYTAALEDMRALRRWAFGSRRERIVESPDQLHLFDLNHPGAENEEAHDTSEGEEDSESTTDRQATRRRRRKQRQLNLDALPQVEHEHDVSDEEKSCRCCGQEKVCIGEDVSRVLEFEPASLHVHVHKRKKYVCRCGGDSVVSAPLPSRPLDRSIAGPGLLSALLVGKFGDHLPLYRLEDIFVRYGMHIPRSTLCDWVQSCAELLRPLYELQKTLVLQSPLLWTDDTPITFLGDTENPGSHTGRFWTYIGDDDHPYAVYDFTKSHTRDGPAQFLASWSGYLHADAYTGYDAIIASSNGKTTEVACWAHARRKFFDARSHQPRECHQILEWIRQLYDIEDRAAELTVDDRLSLRQSESVSILNRIETQLRLHHATALPKSAFGKAVTYAWNQWRALTTFTTDGRLTIDNNTAERTLRPQTIGRKNWLFLGSERAGERAAVLSTILAGAKRHRLEPFAYVGDLLLKTHAESSDLTSLLPDHWGQSHPEFVLKHRLDESRRKAKAKRDRRRLRRKTR